MESSAFFVKPVALDSPVRRRSSAEADGQTQAAKQASKSHLSSLFSPKNSNKPIYASLTARKGTPLEEKATTTSSLVVEEEDDRSAPFLSRLAIKISEAQSSGLPQDSEGLSTFLKREGEEEVCKRLVEAMQESPKVSDTQENGSWAIIYLCALHYTRQLGAAGACQALLKALRLHSEDRSVTLHSLGALAFLAEDAGNRDIFFSLGGYGRLTDTMGSWADSEIQFWACKAIWEFCAHEACCSQLKCAGAFHAVLNALRNYGSSAEEPDGAEWCLGALAALGASSESTSEETTRCIISSMSAHSKSYEVQQQGCRALRSLIVAKQIWVPPPLCCDAILSAMSQHQGSMSVQTEGCATLYALACGSSEEDRRAFQEAGAIGVLRSIKANFLRESELMQWTSRCIVAILGDEI